MSDALQRLLDGDLAPEVYRSLSRADADRLAQRVERAGWRCFVVRGAGVSDKAALLAAFAQSMAFPSYFGYNWDALSDVLCDLGWAPTQRGYVLLLDDLAPLAAGAPEVFATLLQVLRGAVAFWRDTATPLVVLLRRAGRPAGTLPRLARP